MENLRWASAVEQAAAVRDGTISGTELLELTVGCMEEIDPIVGRRGADEILLRLAQERLAASDWTTRRPPIP